MRHSSPNGAAGVTLVELAIVIVVTGIVAAFAVPRFFDDRTFLERGYYEELAAALNYSRKLAVASGCRVRVVIDATGHAARQQAADGASCASGEDAWPGNLTFANRDLLAGAKPLGVTVSPAVTLTFDAFGRTDLLADQEISVGPFALTIDAVSGFVTAR